MGHVKGVYVTQISFRKEMGNIECIYVVKSVFLMSAIQDFVVQKHIAYINKK